MPKQQKHGGTGANSLVRSFSLITILMAFISLLRPASALALANDEIGQWRIRITGYAKNIVMYTEPGDMPMNVVLGLPDYYGISLGTLEMEEHWDNYTRLRLRMDGRRGSTYAWELHYEMRGLASNPDYKVEGFLEGLDPLLIQKLVDPRILQAVRSIESGKADLSMIGGQSGGERFLPLEATVYDETGYRMEHLLDRAWFRYTPDWGEIIVGRQAITWTLGRLWFPTDLFGPFLPYDVDQDEKPGVDAVNAAVNLGVLTSVRVIYAPLERREDARVGARINTAVKGFGLHLMGGYFSGDRVVGGSVSHNLAGAVVRAEAAYTHPLEGDDRWSLIVNADRALPHDTYLCVEYFHQSEGATDNQKYWEKMELYRAGKLSGLASDYVGMIFNWQTTPLVQPGVIAVDNIIDGSVFAGPNVRWNPVQNVNVTAAANLFVGNGHDTEYSYFPNIYYVAVKAYF